MKDIFRSSILCVSLKKITFLGESEGWEAVLVM